MHFSRFYKKFHVSHILCDFFVIIALFLVQTLRTKFLTAKENQHLECPAIFAGQIIDLLVVHVLFWYLGRAADF